jgi:hypothetical protein
MTQDELKLVFDALRECNIYALAGGLGLQAAAHRDALAILEKAIAELESQKPYAWVAEDVCESQIINGRPRKIWWECEKGVGKAIYTHPPQRTEPVAEDSSVAQKRTWAGLTDEDIWDAFGGRIGTSNSDVNPIRLLADARKIEAKLKEKNT